MTKFLGRTALGAVLAIFCGEAHGADTGTTSQSALEDIVVTATRRVEGRPALESPVPIDVVQGDALGRSGYADLSRGLQFQVPSVNFNRAATTATAASTRPITLRGLAPDQVLVLVNGKRRHASSILNTNNSIGRGSAPVDLNTIPDAAIERIEILRDGAAAQYGSDAIAGVVNIILREDASGGYGALQGGITDQGDGADESATGRVGFDLGGRGHLTVSGQIRHQDPTNRANVDQRFGWVTYKIGDPRISDFNGAIDSSYSLGGNGELYLFGTGSYRVAQSPSGFRTPTTAPTLYPAGYVALINPRIADFGVTGGYRTTFGNDWHFDVSHTVGYDQANFVVGNTVNLSLGPNGAASPQSFYAGGVTYRQHVTDALLTKSFDVLRGLNIAAGAQDRLELYKIKNGEPLAYFGAGADGFPGFNPRNPVDKNRNAYAGFVDLELDATRFLTLGAAGRYDHYSDFGGAATWKSTARLAATDWLAFRAAASTGFRAPSMQQQYFSAVTNNLSSTGALVTVGTLPVTDPVARALGATALKPEKSKNYSAGIVLTPTRNFYFTADYFRIEIENRIALSEQLSGTGVANILTAAGIRNFQQVRFFTNAIDTNTEGFELSGRYSTAIGTRANLALGFGYGRFLSNLERLAPNGAIPSLPLLATKSLIFVTKGQPKDKVTFDATLDYAPFTFNVDVTRFGSVQGADLATLQTYSAKTLVDLSLGVALSKAMSITAGVQNVGDVYPDQPVDNRLASVIAATGGSFPAPEEAPFGFNGRSYYLRLESNF